MQRLDQVRAATVDDVPSLSVIVEEQERELRHLKAHLRQRLFNAPHQDFQQSLLFWLTHVFESLHVFRTS
jgi:hypothetical protein